MIDWYLIFLGIPYWLVLVVLLIISTYHLCPDKDYKPRNKPQAESTYEYRKLMFLRWNWFLSVAVLGFFSVTVTYLLDNKFSIPLVIIGSIFLGVLAYTIYFTHESYRKMMKALEILLEYL